MTRYSRTATFAALSILWCGVATSAETLRCQSVNGNVTCAGPDAASCQTVNGRTVCVGGHGGVVQSFGNSTAPDTTGDSADAGVDADGPDDPAPGPAIKQRLEQHDPHGHTLLLDRDGTKLHLRSDWLSVDRD
jgi:hypothetical protein